MQQPLAPQNPRPAQPADVARSPARAAMTFLLCAIYFSLTLVVVGLAVRVLEVAKPAISAQLWSSLLTTLLLFTGFLRIAQRRIPYLRPLSAVGLVRRPSADREMALGEAIGWAAGIALVLPGLLLLRMHGEVSLDGFHVGATIASTLVLLLYVLGRQFLLCGLPFRSLTEATSPLFASAAFAGVAALLTLYTAHGDAAEALLAAMAQLVFGTAALRTRAIWLGTALQFAWGFTVTLLFGLPSFLWPPALGVVAGRMFGARWLTGGRLGPEAALWAALVVLLALIAVWRVTRDYAWHYTFEPIVSAGYPMEVAPPAEHVRMEQAASKRDTPLVQIGGAPLPVPTPVEPAPTPIEPLRPREDL